MSKKIPDLSNHGGERQDFLDYGELSDLMVKMGVKSNQASELLDRLDTEIFNLVKGLKLLDDKADAKKSKRDIDFRQEIEKTAKRFEELVTKGPPVISNNPELLEICDHLEAVPSIFRELEQKPHLAQLGLQEPYAGRMTSLRRDFVADIHALYHLFTGKDDWITFDSYEESHTNPFFKLVTVCYRAAGLDVSDSTIRSDISEVRKVGNKQSAAACPENIDSGQPDHS